VLAQARLEVSDADGIHDYNLVISGHVVNELDAGRRRPARAKEVARDRLGIPDDKLVTSEHLPR
jgi:hypothetical protein